MDRDYSYNLCILYRKKMLLGKMLGDGLADSVGEDYERGFAFWFLICGIVLDTLGGDTSILYKERAKPAPAFWVIACCFYCGWLYICSGFRFWLFLPQAVIINLFE